MLAQEVTECQGTSLLLSTRFHDVNMIRMWPFPRAMKEGADGVVNMGNVNVAECGERFGVTPDGLQLLHRDLNINDGLCVQPRNGSRAVVVDAVGDLSEILGDSIALCFKFKRPARIVCRDLEFSHDSRSHLTGSHPIINALQTVARR